MKRADVDAYRAKLDKAVEEAQGKLAGAYAQMNGWPTDQKRDALGDVFAELCRQYGDAVGVTASDFYALIRSQSSETSTYKPVLAPNVPAEQVRAAYSYSAKQLYTKQPDKIIKSLNGRLRRYVEYTARETVHVNASRDRARTFWARVPSGGKTCAWCLMLASRGWVYATEQTAGGVGNEFHNDDRCMIIPSFDDSPELEGYDPDAMYEKYNQARDEVLSDGLEPTDKNIAGRLRDMFPDELKDGSEVPSILGDAAQGWPEGIQPVKPRIWRHVLTRHLPPDGKAASHFHTDSKYEISKIIRETLSNPDLVLDKSDWVGVRNYHKMIDGNEYIVGIIEKNGVSSVTTAFPPSPMNRRIDV